MYKKITVLLILTIVLIFVAGVEGADIKKTVPGVSQTPVYPDIWVKAMPYSAEGLKKDSIFTVKFKVFKNKKVNAPNWRIDLKVNGMIKKSIYAQNVKFIPLRSKEGKSYYNAILNYTIPKYGKYKFTCFADSLNQVNEKSILNNKKSVSIDVKIPYKLIGTLKQLKTDILLFNEQVKIFDVDKEKGYVEGSMIAFNCDWKRIGKEPPFDFVVTAYVNGERVSPSFGRKGDKTGSSSCGWRAIPGYHVVRFQVEKPFGDFPTETNSFKTISFQIKAK